MGDIGEGERKVGCACRAGFETGSQKHSLPAKGPKAIIKATNGSDLCDLTDTGPQRQQIGRRERQERHDSPQIWLVSLVPSRIWQVSLVIWKIIEDWYWAWTR